MSPPSNKSLVDLLRFIFDHGIGIRLGNTWTDVSLEDAFAQAGYSIDRRSIQSWLSGKTIPSIGNLQALSRIIGSNQEGRSAWRFALVQARRGAIKARKAEKLSRKEDSPEPVYAEPLTSHNINSTSMFRRRPISWMLILLASIALIWSISSVHLPSTINEPLVQNITFCSVEGFSKDTFECVSPSEFFPSAIQTIMITFDFVGLPHGTPFERVWYLNGEEIHRKGSFNDKAWPGYTYYTWPNGFSDGEYALRVYIDDVPYTAKFRVGRERGPFMYD